MDNKKFIGHVRNVKIKMYKIETMYRNNQLEYEADNVIEL